MNGKYIRKYPYHIVIYVANSDMLMGRQGEKEREN